MMYPDSFQYPFYPYPHARDRVVPYCAGTYVRYGTVFVASVGTLQASAGIHLLFFIDKVPVTYCKVYRSDSHN